MTSFMYSFTCRCSSLHPCCREKTNAATESVATASQDTSPGVASPRRYGVGACRDLLHREKEGLHRLCLHHKLAATVEHVLPRNHHPHYHHHCRSMNVRARTQRQACLENGCSSHLVVWKVTLVRPIRPKVVRLLWIPGEDAIALGLLDSRSLRPHIIAVENTANI